ncbi:MAG: hypothetical protein AAF498_05020 [Pseudomonadota bacterium]
MNSELETVLRSIEDEFVHFGLQRTKRFQYRRLLVGGLEFGIVLLINKPKGNFIVQPQACIFADALSKSVSRSGIMLPHRHAPRDPIVKQPFPFSCSKYLGIDHPELSGLYSTTPEKERWVNLFTKKTNQLLRAANECLVDGDSLLDFLWVNRYYIPYSEFLIFEICEGRGGFEVNSAEKYLQLISD